MCGSSSVVECHLAKVDVAGPNPVYRSTCGCSSMVEPQPSKLVTWVRFPSPAPACKGKYHEKAVSDEAAFFVCANLISNSMRVDHPCHPPTMGERRGGGGDRKATASRPQARNPCKKQPGRVWLLHTGPDCLAYRNMHTARTVFHAFDVEKE